MSVNETLLRSVMDHIETWPNLLDQNQWRCGTARCFAGWAAELSGAQWISGERDQVQIDTAEGRWFAGSVVRSQSGELRHVADFARRELGLTEIAADQLFDGSNTITELREMVENLCDFGTVYDAAPKTQAEVTAP
ncbi:hypothetical protein C7T36_18280 [Rhodococcus sp. AD45-ID]|uniref:hypothetical protein n=1 Tax=unclassified Rhodococcus (in: high G+C Gram-positive bacteria) TaxID=192944 RepID=UPI0005D306ED|nr:MULTISPECIES: hypothetical protein [unclassified Rhodococcus (in: high G+C Gram-positive bacteria)]KJF21926.1 hypothetical protein SZ00_02570 [Rhodococcus sp. AD45]PSR39627.1 hypothetical protein C7T36_18280 [Rhodococcus sp. AD45-ID]